MIREWNITGFAFFYHNDHLGSAAYLTDMCGDVSQTLNYLPYGEDWIDVRRNLDPNLGQYSFNGKEKDWESGFHYYGARYYWSEVLTGWLSVDPLADKYPEIIPTKDMTPGDIGTFQTPIDYNAVMKKAIEFSDGVICNSASVDACLPAYAKELGKPVLEGDATTMGADVINDFYNKF